MKKLFGNAIRIVRHFFIRQGIVLIAVHCSTHTGPLFHSLAAVDYKIEGGQQSQQAEHDQYAGNPEQLFYGKLFQQQLELWTTNLTNVLHNPQSAPK